MTITAEIEWSPGDGSILGATRVHGGWNFAVFSSSAKEVSLDILEIGIGTKLAAIPLERTGDVWHAWVEDLPSSFAYGFRVNNSDQLLLDPYGRVLETSRQWNEGDPLPRCISVACELPHFDWEGIKAPKIQNHDLVLYELHIRGFTADPSSGCRASGTFTAAIEKIPHLKELGVNAVELMPVCEFFESEYQLYHQGNLTNYWGYSPVNWYTPMGRYTHGSELTAGITEFRTLVRELHRAGIAVILDVVYNHTAEGPSGRGPTLCYRGLDEQAYYLKDAQGRWNNASGCGNTVQTAYPAVQDLILDSLRYWVSEMGVDGFRFDLATILSRDSSGAIMEVSPLQERIANDPLLADTLLISEPWDAEGRYQVGGFGGGADRWYEWNDRFRDDIRQFIKGTDGFAGAFAQRFSGSKDLFEERSPCHSINFITCHDGFTLADLVSYGKKHNDANGEGGVDGHDNNCSWNCGVEGHSNDPEIMALRRRQQRNLLLALLTAQGTPMLQMGDEYGHSRTGNNNAWCQDNQLNWFRWDQLESNRHLCHYLSTLTKLRVNHPALGLPHFLTHDHVAWHGQQLGVPDWTSDSRLVALELFDRHQGNDLYLAFNASSHEQTVQLPDGQWWWLIDTYEETGVVDESRQAADQLTLKPYSAAVLQRNGG